MTDDYTDLSARFTLAPLADELGDYHRLITDAAYELNTAVPGAGREKSLALRALEDALYWGNAAQSRQVSSS